MGDNIGKTEVSASDKPFLHRRPFERSDHSSSFNYIFNMGHYWLDHCQTKTSLWPIRVQVQYQNWRIPICLMQVCSYANKTHLSKEINFIELHN